MLVEAALKERKQRIIFSLHVLLVFKALLQTVKDIMH